MKMIKDGVVIDNPWQSLHSDELIANTPLLLTPEQWQQHKSSLSSPVGLLLNTATDLEALDKAALNLPVIAIEFPAFTDGRGFSLARLLRERYHYKGELRAVGNAIRDQLCYLKRCGFNAFEIDGDIEAAVASLNDFTESYQTSVDQPEPLFTRRLKV